MTQVIEKKEGKKRGKHGYTWKKGYLPNAIVRKVDRHFNKLQATTSKDLDWHDALVDLLKSHPELNTTIES
jgi:hypothetical protein